MIRDRCLSAKGSGQSIRLFLSVIVSLVFTIFLLFVITTLYGGTGEGETITVDDDGSADYETIQDAIDNATAGDTIRVFNGTYYENVVVNKTVSLVGNGSEVTRISQTREGDVVFINADHVNISGFSIGETGKFDAGIDIISNFTSVSNINCSNNHYGVQLSFSNNNFLSNITSLNSEYTVSLWHSDFNDLNNITSVNNSGGIMFLNSENNTLINSTCSDSENAIYNWASDGNTFNNNNFSDNIHGITFIVSKDCILEANTMIGCGISISNDIEYWNSYSIDTSNTVNGKPVYYYSDISGITVPSGAGQIILANCSQITIENQNCSNASIGISIGFSSNIILENNTCLWNSEYGIFMKNSSSCEISRNNFSQNHYGIRIENSESLMIKGNTAIENKWGMYLRTLSNIMMLNNIISFSDDEGIRMYYSNNFTIENNSFSFNKWMGFNIKYSNNNVSISNNSFSNDDIGIHLDYSANCIITQNTISSITSGITLDNTVNCSVISNSCRGRSGIEIWRSNNCTITINQVSWNVNGLFIYHVGNTTILNNNCSSNVASGIKLHHSDNMKIQSNECSNNNWGVFATDSSLINVWNNTFTHNSYAINLDNSHDNIITENSIENNSIGINLVSASLGNDAQWNIISNNTKYGISAKDNHNEFIIAYNNFWGHSSGPYHIDMNPNGSGDNITDYVYYEPRFNDQEDAIDTLTGEPNRDPFYLLLATLIALFAVLVFVVRSPPPPRINKRN